MDDGLAVGDCCTSNSTAAGAGSTGTTPRYSTTITLAVSSDSPPLRIKATSTFTHPGAGRPDHRSQRPLDRRPGAGAASNPGHRQCQGVRASRRVRGPELVDGLSSGRDKPIKPSPTDGAAESACRNWILALVLERELHSGPNLRGSRVHEEDGPITEFSISGNRSGVSFLHVQSADRFHGQIGDHSKVSAVDVRASGYSAVSFHHWRSAQE